MTTIETLYDRHVDAIFRYIVRRVGRIAEAEDLTSQTFYKALRSLWRFDEKNEQAWLYRIATNEVNDYFRRRRSAESALEAQPTQRAEQAAAEAELARHELYTRLHQALSDLAVDD